MSTTSVTSNTQFALAVGRRAERLGGDATGSNLVTVRHPALKAWHEELRAGEPVGSQSTTLQTLLDESIQRGARVHRCVERRGEYEVVEFDAFGFRAPAAIATLGMPCWTGQS